MKRIQIRFILLISEKFFKAKRAHPNWNRIMKDTLKSNTTGSPCLILGTVPVKFMNTYIDEPLDVALLEVEEDRCVVEVGQVRHVLATVVLRRIHLIKNKDT